MKPRAPRKRRQRFVPNAPNIVYVAAGPAIVLALFVPLGLIVPSFGLPVPPLLLLAVLAFMLLPMGWWIYRVVRFSSRISQTDGFLCLNCHYDLHGLPDRGDCPECGETYDREELVRRWNIWLLSQTKNQKTVQPRVDDTQHGPPRPPLRKPRAPKLIYLTILPLALIPSLAIGAMVSVRTGTVPLWVPPGVGAIVVTVALLNARRVTRFVKRVRAADNLLCLRCHHDLRSAASDEGACPACGEYYWKSGVRKRWREYLISGHLGNG